MTSHGFSVYLGFSPYSISELLHFTIPLIGIYVQLEISMTYIHIKDEVE